jgi:hypothetical protein
MNKTRVWKGLRLTALVFAPIAVFAIAFALLRDSTGGGAPGVSRNDFSRDEQVQQIIDAFELYAEAYGERFPSVEEFQGDVLLAEIERKIDLPVWAAPSPRWGFSHLTVLQQTDPTFGYYGSEVTYGDGDRVLVHWSPADNQHEAIFGDLSHRQADDKQLASLLSPWQRVANECAVSVGPGGSGTVVSADGLILTANHVVDPDRDTIKVYFVDGRMAEAAVLERSLRFDVALLRIPVDEPIPFVALEFDPVDADDPVWLIGYGGGRADPLVREAKALRYILPEEFLTTWNDIIGGDSGGAALDAEGHLVGVILGPGEPEMRTQRTCSTAAIRDLFPALAQQP